MYQGQCTGCGFCLNVLSIINPYILKPFPQRKLVPSNRAYLLDGTAGKKEKEGREGERKEGKQSVREIGEEGEGGGGRGDK